MKKNKFLSFFKDCLYVFVIAVVLLLLVDFLLGKKILSIARNEPPKEAFRVPHPVYHHSLAPSFDGLGNWGSWTYRVCTDASGFKVDCLNKGTLAKTFDIAFMGDSFTEGVGLPYEKSFVGMVAKDNPNLSIANLGVVSYSPSIYLTKLKSLYSEGYRFGHVVVFIDIGDIQDEALTYFISNGRVLTTYEQMPSEIIPKLRRHASQQFSLLGFLWTKIKEAAKNSTAPIAQTQNENRTSIANSPPEITTSPFSAQRTTSQSTIPPTWASYPFISKLSAESRTRIADPISPTPSNTAPATSIYAHNYSRGEWTYNPKSSDYGVPGVAGALEKSLALMNDVYELVKSHGGKFSVGVYPWPSQIKYDREDSLQSRIWKEFCIDRCLHFYDTYPAFFDLIRAKDSDAVILEYYFGGDMHFNEMGNRVIADTINRIGVE